MDESAALEASAPRFLAYLENVEVARAPGLLIAYARTAPARETRTVLWALVDHPDKYLRGQVMAVWGDLARYGLLECDRQVWRLLLVTASSEPDAWVRDFAVLALDDVETFGMLPNPQVRPEPRERQTAIGRLLEQDSSRGDRSGASDASAEVSSRRFHLVAVAIEQLGEDPDDHQAWVSLAEVWPESELLAIVMRCAVAPGPRLRRGALVVAVEFAKRGQLAASRHLWLFLEDTSRRADDEQLAQLALDVMEWCEASGMPPLASQKRPAEYARLAHRHG